MCQRKCFTHTSDLTSNPFFSSIVLSAHCLMFSTTDEAKRYDRLGKKWLDYNYHSCSPPAEFGSDFEEEYDEVSKSPNVECNVWLYIYMFLYVPTVLNHLQNDIYIFDCVWIFLYI